MSYLSIDNIVGVQPTTTSSTFLQGNIIDVYNGTTNYTHITSVSTAAPNNLIIPDASGYFVATTGSQTIQSKMLHSQQGSQSDPSYSFLGDTDSGWFRDAANTIGITTGGTKRMSISDTNIISVLPITATIFKATSGTFPTCAFTNGTNDQTGLYFGTTTTCAIACNGATKFTFGSSSNTSFQQITIPDGSNGTPSLNFSSASNLGFYNGGSNRIIIISNGSSAATISNTQFLVNSTQLSIQNGTLATNGLNFSGESGSGIYKAGVGDVRITANGNQSLGIESQGIKLYGSTAGNNASYSASKLGYYEEFTENLTFSCGNRSVTTDVKFVRVGNSVTCQITSNIVILAPSTAQQFVTSTAFQTRFRPSNTIYFAWWVNDDATSQQRTWRGMISTGGIIEMYREAGVSSLGYTLFALGMSWSIY